MKTYSSLSLPQFLAGPDGEEDQLGLELLQALHILLKWLNRLVVTPVIYSNANSAGILGTETSSLQHTHQGGTSTESIIRINIQRKI